MSHCGKPANNLNLGKQSPLTTLFCFLPHFLPMPHPSLRVSGKLIIVRLSDESFKIWYIFEFQWFTSLLQSVIMTDYFSKNLFESPTSYICFKAILNLLQFDHVIFVGFSQTCPKCSEINRQSRFWKKILSINAIFWF